MKIKIIQIGKDKDAWVSEAGLEFLKRLKSFCEVEIVTLKDVMASKTFSREKVREEEGVAILSVLGEQTASRFVIALDEKGTGVSSKDFAKMLEEKKDLGVGEIIFVIGGAYGLSDGVRKRADKILSFSKMTFTHQMIRVILLEQIYRAFTIIVGKEYHY